MSQVGLGFLYTVGTSMFESLQIIRNRTRRVLTYTVPGMFQGARRAVTERSFEYLLVAQKNSSPVYVGANAKLLISDKVRPRDTGRPIGGHHRVIDPNSRILSMVWTQNLSQLLVGLCHIVALFPSFGRRVRTASTMLWNIN